jgi:hypothetical protein
VYYSEPLKSIAISTGLIAQGPATCATPSLTATSHARRLLSQVK